MAETLRALGRLEYNAGFEDAAEPVTRRMLDLLKDAAPDPATRMLRARGERSLGDRFDQGHNSEALALYESSMSALRDLQSQKYGDKNLADEINMNAERLAGAKAGVGDLDGALNDNLEMLRNSAACDEQAPPGKACRTWVIGWPGRAPNTRRRGGRT